MNGLKYNILTNHGKYVEQKEKPVTRSEPGEVDIEIKMI